MERFLQMVNDDADHLPGSGPVERSMILRSFEALSRAKGRKGVLTKEDVLELIHSVTGRLPMLVPVIALLPGPSC